MNNEKTSSHVIIEITFGYYAIMDPESILFNFDGGFISTFRLTYPETRAIKLDGVK